MEKPVDFSKIEAVKENVRPMKAGRNIVDLGKSIGSSKSKEKLAAERRNFEDEISNGNDDLSIWSKYIKWVKNSYPAGGSKSKLFPVLERCTRRFVKESKYKNSKKYLRIWMDYIQLMPTVSDKLQTLEYLNENEIGVGYALFYTMWACHQEDNGNVKQASAILQLGINRNAVPVKKVKEFMADVLKRVGAKKPERNANRSKKRKALGSIYSASKDPERNPVRRQKSNGSAQSSSEVFRDSSIPNEIGRTSLAPTSLPTSSSAAPAELPRVFDRQKENMGVVTTWNEPLRGALKRAAPSSVTGGQTSGSRAQTNVFVDPECAAKKRRPSEPPVSSYSRGDGEFARRVPGQMTSKQSAQYPLVPRRSQRTPVTKYVNCPDDRTYMFDGEVVCLEERRAMHPAYTVDFLSDDMDMTVADGEILQQRKVRWGKKGRKQRALRRLSISEAPEAPCLEGFDEADPHSSDPYSANPPAISSAVPQNVSLFGPNWPSSPQQLTTTSVALAPPMSPPTVYPEDIKIITPRKNLTYSNAVIPADLRRSQKEGDTVERFLQSTYTEQMAAPPSPEDNTTQVMALNEVMQSFADNDDTVFGQGQFPFIGITSSPYSSPTNSPPNRSRLNQGKSIDLRSPSYVDLAESPAREGSNEQRYSSKPSQSSEPGQSKNSPLQIFQDSNLRSSHAEIEARENMPPKSTRMSVFRDPVRPLASNNADTALQNQPTQPNSSSVQVYRDSSSQSSREATQLRSSKSPKPTSMSVFRDPARPQTHSNADITLQNQPTQPKSSSVQVYRDSSSQSSRETNQLRLSKPPQKQSRVSIFRDPSGSKRQSSAGPTQENEFLPRENKPTQVYRDSDSQPSNTTDNQQVNQSRNSRVPVFRDSAPSQSHSSGVQTQQNPSRSADKTLKIYRDSKHEKPNPLSKKKSSARKELELPFDRRASTSFSNGRDGEMRPRGDRQRRTMSEHSQSARLGGSDVEMEPAPPLTVDPFCSKERQKIMSREG
eukprot:966345_1